MQYTSQTPATTRTRRPSGLVGLALIVAVAVVAGTGRADGPPKTVLKTEQFNKDPGWEGVHNRIVPIATPTITQDFGYSPTSFAAKTNGEIGGQVWRAAEPAWYADKIGPKTLDDKLTARGTFALTKTGGGGHVFFGWFNSRQPAGASRAVAALGLEIGTEKIGGRVHVRLHTAQNQSCGMIVQPAGERKARGPFRNDGTRYTWKLDYDPQANGGQGRITFTFRSNLAQPETFERETYVLDLPDGYRKQGTVFDRFGLMNGTKPGGHATAYFGNLEYDGRLPDLAEDPRWEAVGNRAVYTAKQTVGAQDFGFSNTAHAGGKPGEVGARSGGPARTGATTPTASAPSRSTTGWKRAARCFWKWGHRTPACTSAGS